MGKASVGGGAWRRNPGGCLDLFDTMLGGWRKIIQIHRGAVRVAHLRLWATLSELNRYRNGSGP